MKKREDEEQDARARIEEQLVDKIIDWRLSLIQFIEDMWGLTPQPLAEEYFDEAQDAINRGAWEDFKAEWFLEFVKGEHFTWQQWLIFLAVERGIRGLGPKRITVSSGHGIGKDAALSMIILWYLFCFLEAIVPCTAPTSEQMYDILWKELKKWLSKMPIAAQDKYEWSASYVRMADSPETWFARARTARKENTEALAGIHGDYVFMAVDEASGVPEEIYNTAEGSLTNENVLVLLISNATRTNGYFYDSHNERCGACNARRMRNLKGTLEWKGGDPSCEHEVEATLQWQRLMFDSRESPIVDWSYVRRIAAKHGEDSDEYKIRVTGRFPGSESTDEDGYTQLMDETDLNIVADVGGFRPKWARLGVDPAGGGKNETVWVLRDRFRAKIIGVEKQSTGKTIAAKTITFMDMYGIPDWQVTVDAFGEGTDAVQELALAGYRVFAVNTGEQCEEEDDRALYINIRSMSSWLASKWIKAKAELVRNKRWAQCTVIRYRRQLSGKLKIMDKLEMRKRGIKSPDAWDALTLTFIRPDSYEVREVDDSSDQDVNDAIGLYRH